MPRNSPRVALPDPPIGHLTPLHYAGGSRWLCRCVCGRELAVPTNYLTSGHTRSCGCRTSDLISRAVAKHGHGRVGRRSREFVAYWNMIRRCTNPAHNRFEHYGGRGIFVVDRWRGDGGFERFLADMGPCPPGHTIDREDVDGPYGPDNCRWLPKAEQADNTRDTIWVEIDGQRRTLRQWSRANGIEPRTAWARIKAGWDPAVAVTKPVDARRRNRRCEESPCRSS